MDEDAHRAQFYKEVRVKKTRPGCFWTGVPRDQRSRGLNFNPRLLQRSEKKEEDEIFLCSLRSRQNNIKSPQLWGFSPLISFF